MVDFMMQPIGTIHTPLTEKRKTPIQASRSDIIGNVEVFSEFEEGLKDIEHFSHIYLLYLFHESSGYSLRVKPFLDDYERGLFSTRYPRRPNPIGISVVKLLSLEGNILKVESVDILDKTPLLDIKPYVPDFDIRTGVRSGWYDTRTRK